MARTWGARTEEGVKSAVKSLGCMAEGPVLLFSSCFHRKEGYWNFPGGPGVKNPPSHTGDVGSIPGRRTKIPHAAEQLSPRAPTGKKVVRCNQVLHAATKTQRSHKREGGLFVLRGEKHLTGSHLCPPHRTRVVF